MHYLLDVIKVQWVPFLAFLVYTATPKNTQSNDVKAPGCNKKRHVAPKCLLRTHSTFSKSVVVSMGVFNLELIDLIFVDVELKISGASCFWLKSHCLQCVISVPYSLPSNMKCVTNLCTFVPFTLCTLHQIGFVLLFCYNGLPATMGLVPFWQPSTLCCCSVSTAVLLNCGE